MKKNIYSKVFLWMFLGLLITFVTAYCVSFNANALRTIFKTGFYWVLIIVEIGLAIFLSARIHKMQPTLAKICYLLYTFFTGLTFSSIFVVYKLTSITYIFGVSAVLFLIFAGLGRYTKINLTKFGTFLFMMLIGVIILSILSIFIPGLNLVTAIISIVVFLGYIAFDMQLIKKREGLLNDDNLAIIGAFELYLDFINVFIDLLRIFGDSRD